MSLGSGTEIGYGGDVTVSSSPDRVNASATVSPAPPYPAL